MSNAVVTWIRANAWAWFATALDLVKRVVKAVWASFAALIKSPAVWLACGIMFVAGFSAGHIERSAAVRSLKQKAAALESDKVTLGNAAVAARAREKALATTVANLRQELATAQAAVPAPEAAPAPKRAPAAKKPRIASKPSPAPAPLFRSPFGG